MYNNTLVPETTNNTKITSGFQHM